MAEKGKDVCSRVEDMLGAYLAERELEIYKTEFRREGPEWKLRVYLDKTDGAEEEYVGIDECEETARFLSDRLDEDDFIDKAYTLEVASPGMDRELYRQKDFDRFAGSLVEVKLYEPIDGSRLLTGELKGLVDGNIVIDADGREYSIPEKKASKVNLAIVF